MKMFDECIRRLPCVQKILKQYDLLYEQNKKTREESDALDKCIDEIKKYNKNLQKNMKMCLDAENEQRMRADDLECLLTYLVSEVHTVWRDDHGNYIPIDDNKIEKYRDYEIVMKNNPPLTIKSMYAREKNEKYAHRSK